MGAGGSPIPWILLQFGANIDRCAVTDQFVIDIIVEGDTLAGTGALYVLAEIDLRVLRSTHGIIADSPYDVPKLLLLPSPVAGIRAR